MSTKETEFAVEIWNGAGDYGEGSWDCYKGGIHCARVANQIAETLMDRGFFARVVTVD
jgi:hypothetical protein